MKVSLEKKKQEAIKRMNLLGLYKNIIVDFDKDNIVYVSEGNGILYWLTNYPNEWQAEVKRVQDKYNLLVYHAQLSFTGIGDMLTLFYVSDHQNEWNSDNKDLSKNYACVYVINTDYDECSEFGYVGFKSINGGLKRTS